MSGLFGWAEVRLGGELPGDGGAGTGLCEGFSARGYRGSLWQAGNRRANGVLSEILRSR